MSIHETRADPEAQVAHVDASTLRASRDALDALLARSGGGESHERAVHHAVPSAEDSFFGERTRQRLVELGYVPLCVRCHEIIGSGHATCAEVWVGRGATVRVELTRVPPAPDGSPQPLLRFLSAAFHDGRRLVMWPDDKFVAALDHPTRRSLAGSGDLEADLARFAEEMNAEERSCRAIVTPDVASLARVDELIGRNRSRGARIASWLLETLERLKGNADEGADPCRYFDDVRPGSFGCTGS